MAEDFLIAPPQPGFEPSWFEEQIVEVRVNYRGNTIEVNPEQAVVFYDPWRRDPRKPRQARWLIKGLASDHILLILPKNGSRQPDLFNPEGEGKFAIPGLYNTVASGLPHEPNFDDDGRIRWSYDVVVLRYTPQRQYEEVLRIDPDVFVQKDY